MTRGVSLDADGSTDVGRRPAPRSRASRSPPSGSGEGSGIANALYFVRRGGHRWVLRRPPAVKNHPSASDTGREWRILHALEGTPVPHPAPAAVLRGPRRARRDVHDHGPGRRLHPGLRRCPRWLADDPAASARARHGLRRRPRRALEGRLGAPAGSRGWASPTGFLDRQVARWLAQLDGYRVRELPEERLPVRLARGQPPGDEPGRRSCTATTARST